MTINVNTPTVKGALNDAQPGQLADLFRKIALGDVVRAMGSYLRGKALDGAAATNKYVLAAAQSITLPDDAKASRLLKVYARAGTGTKGPLVIDAGGDSFGAAEPAAGHCAVSPNGDLLLNHTDAWTSLDIEYAPEKYDIIEQTLPVVTNSLTLPVPAGPCLFLLEVESLVGTLVSKLIIDVPGTAPGSGHAALSLDKLTVAFNAGNAVTSARVKFGIYSKTDVNALLTVVESNSFL